MFLSLSNMFLFLYDMFLIISDMFLFLYDMFSSFDVDDIAKKLGCGIDKYACPQSTYLYKR